MSYNQIDRITDKDIINKHYITNKHILLHLKTHLHRLKDSEESLFEHCFSVKNFLEQLQIRRQSKTQSLSFSVPLSNVTNLHVNSSILQLNFVQFFKK